MTTSIHGLKKRLDKLEGPSLDRDFEQEALDSLSDEDLDILQEASALFKSGYSESEIKDMMGDRWLQAEMAIERFEAEITHLMQHENGLPKRYKDSDSSQALAPVNYRAGKRICP